MNEPLTELNRLPYVLPVRDSGVNRPLTRLNRLNCVFRLETQVSRINGPNEQNVNLIPFFPLNLKPKPTFCPDCFFQLSPAFAYHFSQFFFCFEISFDFCLCFLVVLYFSSSVSSRVFSRYWNQNWHTVLAHCDSESFSNSFGVHEAKWCKNTDDERNSQGMQKWTTRKSASNLIMEITFK